MPKSEGFALSEEGAAAALAHADRQEPGWADAAFKHLQAYAKANQTFTTDAVRSYATTQGLPPPPDARAWGGVIRRAAALGLIKHIDWVPAPNRLHHGRPVSLWEAVG